MRRSVRAARRTKRPEGRRSQVTRGGGSSYLTVMIATVTLPLNLQKMILNWQRRKKRKRLVRLSLALRRSRNLPRQKEQREKCRRKNLLQKVRNPRDLRYRSLYRVWPPPPDLQAREPPSPR